MRKKSNNVIAVPESYEAAFITLLMLAYVFIAVASGPDVGFDIKNYHFYVGHIFLHRDGEQHILPAQMQGWFNPLMDGLLVWLMEYLRPVLATAVLAFLQSFTIPLLALLIRQTLKPLLTKLTIVQAALVRGAILLIGVTGAMTVSELGASFGDLLVCIPLLASLVAVGHAFGRGKDKATLWLCVGGFCFGAAVGLKLTAVIFGPGLLLGFFCFQLRPAKIIECLLGFGVAALFGLLIIDGFWLWNLWKTTGNPFFPAMNGLFHSPWIGTATNLLDARFRPHSLLEGLAFPVASVLGQHPGAEASYYDLRFVLTCALLPVAIYQIWRRRLIGWPLAIVLFFYVGFAIWLTMFGIMRYTVPLEFLSGIVMMAVVGPMIGVQYRPSVLCALVLILCFTTHAPQWSPHLDWKSREQQSNWFDVTVPQALQMPDQMFLMLSDQPLSYVIPFFRSDSQFIRMEGNLNPPPGSVLYVKRQEAVRTHKGPFLTLSPSILTDDQDVMLTSYGLRRTHKPCTSLTTNTDLLFVCSLERIK